MLEKSRILLFTTAFLPLIGGSEIAIDEITKRLSDFNFDIITPRYQKDLSAKEIKGHVTIHRIGLGSSFDKYLFPLLGFLKGIRLLHQEGEDFYKHSIHIHAFQVSYGALAAVFLCELMRFPLMLTLQEGKDLAQQSWPTRLIRRWILGTADHITAISSYLIKYATSINPEATFTRIPNGVDSELFHRVDSSSLKHKLGLDGKKIIITVSRLVEKNGVGDLVHALAKIKENQPAIRLIVIGTGPLLSELNTQVEKVNLTNSVTFLGEIKYQDLPRYLSMADVFVRPSHSEGLGNAFLEAMACGIPVIGTPVGGIPDFLKDGETGLFCKVGNSDDIAVKIERVFANPDLAEGLSTKGLELIQKEYQWADIANQFRKAYQQYAEKHTIK